MTPQLYPLSLTLQKHNTASSQLTHHHPLLSLRNSVSIIFQQMRIIRTAESEEPRRTMVARVGAHHAKDDSVASDADDDGEGSLVCVTSGVSYLGLALVNQLLLRGFFVRITVDNPEEIDKLREVQSSGEVMRTSEHKLEAVVAELTDVKSLEEAFKGCVGVFHISAFVDPAGLSGYTKSMAEVEVKAAENVMEACSRTASIRRCVFTSSLAACVWRDNDQSDLSPVINHDSWSSESLCTDRKLWYALGKMKAEKAAWRIANERGFKLTTICPALITGPEFYRRNPTATVAYLKGAQEMYADGVLATVDVTKLAEAHVCVFKAMKRNACGRYICYENVVDGRSEAEKLAKETRMPMDKICGDTSTTCLHKFQLSNGRLCRLISMSLGCYNQYKQGRS